MRMRRSGGRYGATPCVQPTAAQVQANAAFPCDPGYTPAPPDCDSGNVSSCVPVAAPIVTGPATPSDIASQIAFLLPQNPANPTAEQITDAINALFPSWPVTGGQLSPAQIQAAVNSVLAQGVPPDWLDYANTIAASVAQSVYQNVQAAGVSATDLANAQNAANQGQSNVEAGVTAALNASTGPTGASTYAAEAAQAVAAQAAAASAPTVANVLQAQPSTSDYSWLYWVAGGAAVLGIGAWIFMRKPKGA